MNYSSNIWMLYAARFFHGLIPAHVIERLFWEQRGMTVQMVVYTEILYAATVVLLEIPTGIIADKWGRKKMLVLDAVMGCTEFFLLAFATQFWHFAIVVFLAGIGNSASSGAGNAFLYDSLPAEGRPQAFEKSLGRLNAFDLSATTLASLCGGLLASLYGYEFNYWISFISMLVSLCFTLLLTEPEIRSCFDEPAVKGYVSESIRFFMSNPGVSTVLFTGMVTGASLIYVDEFWQIYLERLDVPVIYFGLFTSAYVLARLPGSMFAYMLKKRTGYRRGTFMKHRKAGHWTAATLSHSKSRRRMELLLRCAAIK